MDSDSSDEGSYLDAEARADARFAAAFICSVVAAARRGVQMDGEMLALMLEGPLHVAYSSSDPQIDEALRERAKGLLRAAGGRSKLAGEHQAT